MDDCIAWHFTGNTLRDGSPIPAIGETLRFDGKIRLCERGYHWSLKPHQALEYAPGALLHMVRYGGEVITCGDKGVSSERTILATIDAKTLLRRFAADQALSVAHLWDMPDVVREYLTTLDETKRDAAHIAARATLALVVAARDPEDSAYRAAAWAAAGMPSIAAWGGALGAAAARAAAMGARVPDRAAAWAEFDRRVYAAFGVDGELQR